MKRVLSISCAVFAVAMSVAVGAQDKPNFAGKWAQVADANAGSGGGGRGGGMGLGAEFVAAQDAKTLTVTTNNPQMGEMKQVFNLDGSESKNPLNFNGNSIDRSSKVKWDGNKLVITTTINVNGNSIDSTQTWSMDASGVLTVESTSNFGGNGPMTTKSTYKKAS